MDRWGEARWTARDLIGPRAAETALQLLDDLDEWERETVGMLGDLAEAGELPPSIVALNEAACRHLIEHGFPRPFLAEAILRERDRRERGDEIRRRVFDQVYDPKGEHSL